MWMTGTQTATSKGPHAQLCFTSSKVQAAAMTQRVACMLRVADEGGPLTTLSSSTW